MIGIIIGIIIILFVLFMVFACLIVGARADSNEFNEDTEKEEMASICEKCNQPIEWSETDALIKYKYGTKYIVHCPHCNKLTTIRRNSD